MRCVVSYFKSHFKWIAAMLGLVFLMAFTMALNRVPWNEIFYGVLIVLLLLAVILAADGWRWKRRYTELKQMESTVTVSVDGFCETDDFVEQEYQELIRILAAEYTAEQSRAHGRQKDMQIQLQNALQENSVLREQLQTAQHQAEEVQAQVTSMLEEGPNHSAYRNYVSDLRKKNAFQGKRITALDERVTTALGIIDTLQKENTGLRQRETLLLKQEKELKRQLSEASLRPSYEKDDLSGISSAQADEFQLQIDDLTRDLTMARDRATEVERDFEAEREKNRDLSEQLRSAQTDLESAKVESAKLTEELNSARLALTKAGALNDVNLLAGSVKEELADIGIQAEVIPGEMDMLVGGSYKDDYQVSVDVHNRIIYLEKKLKRAKKYKGMVDELNQMDIRTAYTLQEDRVCCKAFCHNLDQITTLLLELISKMDKLD